MESLLADSDVQLMLTQVSRFCTRSIRSRLNQPGETLSSESLQELTTEATDLGLLHFDSHPAAGLWDTLGQPVCESEQGISFSVAALRLVARESATLAYHLHQQALAAGICRALQLPVERDTVVALQGRYGLARGSLARWLQGRSLSESDAEMLGDYFLGPAADETANMDEASQRPPRLFHSDKEWRRLLVPCFASPAMSWVVYDRQQLVTESLSHSHGLDGLATWQWRTGDDSPRRQAHDRETSRAIYRQALAANAQALVAIGLGALQQGLAQAQEYAALRVQGGKPIVEHAAVARLLATGTSTADTVEALLKHSSQLPFTAEHLGMVLGMRAQAHNLLCAAANDAMQVFGGAGYIRETGLERIVRDNNHLRQLDGTPDELLLFLAEWQRED